MSNFDDLAARLRQVEETDKALEEASSILLSVRINYEKRRDLTVVERELLGAIIEWQKVHPVVGGDA
jgi:hypothetical protein